MPKELIKLDNILGYCHTQQMQHQEQPSEVVVVDVSLLLRSLNTRVLLSRGLLRLSRLLLGGSVFAFQKKRVLSLGLFFPRSSVFFKKRHQEEIGCWTVYTTSIFPRAVVIRVSRSKQRADKLMGSLPGRGLAFRVLCIAPECGGFRLP